MSQMTIDCPECGSPLLVPSEAAGRKARCTKCSTRFIVPSVQEMLEQTVSHMVLEELDERYKDDEGDLDNVQSSTGRQRPEHPMSSNGTVLGMPAVEPRESASDQPTSDPGDSRAGRSVLTHDEMSHDRPADQGPRAERSGDPGASSGPSTSTPPTSAGESTRRGGGSAYPQDLRPRRLRPYLVVRDVSVSGVRLAFAAEWLKHEVFRTSMPIRCAFTGRGPDAGLVSRPMIFINRCDDGSLQARSLELRYEQRLAKQHSPREHVRGIGRMPMLAEPFDQPLLYYAQSTKVGDALTCTASVDIEVEGESCEVLIPHGEVAVDWLSRVNGRCGEEYALLKSAVATLRNDAWSDLPDKVRQRLETWCKFERGERFKLYLKDADLTSADAGLGGVVVTDRRLLYHKFRHSRSLSLNQPAVLHLRTDPKFTRLTLESGGRLARAGKINRADTPRLIEALATAQRLKVKASESETSEA